MTTQTDENQTITKKDSFQYRYFDVIQRVYTYLNILNIVSAISLLLLLKTTEIDVGTVYLILAALPLDIYVFSWVFHKVVIWKDSDKAGKLPYGYICLGLHSPSIIILFFIEMFILYSMLFSSFQCVHGERYLFWITLAIFAILFFVSALLLPKYTNKTKQKLESYLTIAMISVSISWTLTEAVFYDASTPSNLYTAVVIDSYKSHNRGTRYYAIIQLKDGSEQRLHIYKDIYDFTQEDKVVLIRERTSFFGTTFVSIHNPLTYIEEHLKSKDVE